MRERERDQTHSYWYIPSALRVNYSLLVMDSAGMMKMATDDGFPLWQGAGTGSREVFGGYRGLRRRNSRSIVFPEGLGYMDLYRRKKSVRGATRGPRGWRARPGGWACPLPRGLLEASPTSAPCLLDHVCSKKHAPEGFIPFGLHLIFLFFETLK